MNDKITLLILMTVTTLVLGGCGQPPANNPPPAQTPPAEQPKTNSTSQGPAPAVAIALENDATGSVAVRA